MKPLSAWVGDVMYRLEITRAWIEKGTPAVFWISGFYFPQVGNNQQCPMQYYPIAREKDRAGVEASVGAVSERDNMI